MLTEKPNFATLICMKFRFTDLHIHVYGKLRVSMAFSEYFTVFNPFNVNVFAKHQTCLNKYKKYFYRASSAAFHWISSRKKCCVTETVTLTILKDQISRAMQIYAL